MGSNIKQKTVSNLVWRFAERCGAQGVAFIVSIVLARILSPSDYGTIALITVFTTILQVFVDSGFANALIQKKNADDLDFSTVFYFNIVFCFLLYGVMFFAAPWIAEFYNDMALTPLIRVLSLTIVISGVKNIQQAYISRTLQFKRFFLATLGGTLGAAVVGIIMAYCGCGVWALVAQNLFNATVDTVILWIMVRWRPKWCFSFQRLKALFAYGWRLLASTLLNAIYNDIRQLIIGKVYSSASLAYYNKGHQIPNLVVSNINISIDSVLFPVMSNKQDDMNTLKSITRRSIQVSSFFIWPMMFCLVAAGKPLIHILLTDKWMPSFPFLVVFCLAFGLMPIQTANLNAIKAMGRSDIYLRVEIIKKVFGFAMILITMQIGTLAMAIGVGVHSVIASIVNSFPNKSLLNYSYVEQLKDIAPAFCISGVMCLITYSILFLHLGSLVTVLLQIIVGAIVYIGLAALFRLNSFTYLLKSIKLHFSNK